MQLFTCVVQSLSELLGQKPIALYSMKTSPHQFELKCKGEGSGDIPSAAPPPPQPRPAPRPPPQSLPSSVNLPGEDTLRSAAVNSHGPLVLPRGSQSLLSPFQLSVVTESRKGGGGSGLGLRLVAPCPPAPSPRHAPCCCWHAGPTANGPSRHGGRRHARDGDARGNPRDDAPEPNGPNGLPASSPSHGGVSREHCTAVSSCPWRQ